MTKKAPSRDKKLSLRHETLRNLSPEEMGRIQGGLDLICTSVFIPVTGITLTYAIVTGGCD